jgi:hypothetical protein
MGQLSLRQTLTRRGYIPPWLCFENGALQQNPPKSRDVQHGRERQEAMIHDGDKMSSFFPADSTHGHRLISRSSSAWAAGPAARNGTLAP